MRSMPGRCWLRLALIINACGSGPQQATDGGKRRRDASGAAAARRTGGRRRQRRRRRQGRVHRRSGGGRGGHGRRQRGQRRRTAGTRRQRGRDRGHRRRAGGTGGGRGGSGGCTGGSGGRRSGGGTAGTGGAAGAAARTAGTAAARGHRRPRPAPAAPLRQRRQPHRRLAAGSRAASTPGTGGAAQAPAAQPRVRVAPHHRRQRRRGTGGTGGTGGREGRGDRACTSASTCPGGADTDASARPASTTSAASTSPPRTRRSPLRRRRLPSQRLRRRRQRDARVFDSDPPADDGNACTDEICVERVAVASVRARAHRLHADGGTIATAAGRARLRRLRRRDGLPGHRYDLPQARLRQPEHLRLLERARRDGRRARRDRQLPEGGLRQHAAASPRPPTTTTRPPTTATLHGRRVRERRARAPGKARRHDVHGERRRRLPQRRPACSARTAADCPGTDTICRQRTCPGNHTCGHTDAAAGTGAEPDATGNCQKALCDGSGGVMSMATTPTSRSTATPARRTCARTASRRTRTCPPARVRATDGSKACDAARAATRSRFASYASAPARALTSASTAVVRRRAATDGSLVDDLTCRSRRPATTAAHHVGFSELGRVLSLSADGHYLALAGYTPHPNTGTSETTPRGPRRGPIDVAGTVNTSTLVHDRPQRRQRSRCDHADGFDVWISGAGNPNERRRLVQRRGGTHRRGAHRLDARHHPLPRDFGSQLYGSRTTGVRERVHDRLRHPDHARASGPTWLACRPPARTLTGSRFRPDPGGVSGMDTLYVADDAAGLAEVDVQRHDLALGPTLNISGNPGFRGVAGYAVGGTVTLMASTAEADQPPGRLRRRRQPDRRPAPRS